MKKLAAGLSVLGGLFSALPALGATLGDQINANLAYGTTTGLGTRDIREVIMLIINVILGFLSIVAIVIILWGGFKWMTAGGNEDQVGEAKKLIIAGVVGMAVIFTSYAVALFVVRSLVNVST
jgi:TRAP-type C4-dicarboxylate transport system permease small subunit